MERKLSGLSRRPGEYSQGKPSKRSAAQDSYPTHRDRLCCLPNVGYVEGVKPGGSEIVGPQEQVENGY